MKPNQFLGRVCPKHPDDAGLRYVKGGACVACERERRVKGWQRQKNARKTYFIYKLTWGDYAHWYIGCTFDPARRLAQHLSKGSMWRLSAATEKYGKPVMTILETVDSAPDAGARERWHIQNECAEVDWMGGVNSPRGLQYSQRKRG